MTDAAIEQEIQARGATVAPRITPSDVQANIVAEYGFTAASALREGVPVHESLKLLTFCVLVLRNGFTVTGESACASPENFNAEIGHKIARDNAVQKVWPLMGYELRSHLARRAVHGCSDPAPAGGLQPHQQRVVAERAELDERIRKLAVFIDTLVFDAVEPSEQGRMREQLRFMQGYSATLGARIAAFHRA